MTPGAAVVRVGPSLGRVASFDAGRGVGEVEDANGAHYPFHATAISDGSRRIDLGAAVTFTVVPGHGGRYEVRSMSALG